MKRGVLDKGRSMLSRLRTRLMGTPVLRNVFRRSGDTHLRRALFSYLVRPFQVDPERHPDVLLHSQWWQNVALGQLLDELGYQVDVVQFDDARFVPDQPYDLLLGLGRACVRAAECLPDSTTKIYINTGSESTFNNRAEQERLAALARRRGCRVKARRLTSMDPARFALFDALACFGNDWNASLYRPYHDRIYVFNNCGVGGIEAVEKDHATARRGFVYLASHGQVHKGLDLLLEAFASLPDCHLHICTSLRHDSDFVKCYRHELHELPNVHRHGWVTLTSPDFRELCRQCSFVISASCAEAGAGAVVDCMHAGLIPVISRECGIDTGEFGVTLASCEIEEIRRAVQAVSDQPSAWHAERSRLVLATARRDYSRDAFQRRWRAILEEVLGPTLSLTTRAANPESQS